MAPEDTRSVQIEARLEEWNVPFDFDEAFPLNKIQTKAYTQVRQAEHRAPKENVEQYALQMGNGAIFPPIILAQNDKAIIDGNTRVAAAKRCGYKTIAAYIVKPANASIARIIGSTLNQFGGARLTGDELIEVASAYLDEGITDAEIARCLGRTAEWARKFRKKAEFDQRVGDHPAAATVRSTVKERLADIPQNVALNMVLDAVAEGTSLDSGTAGKLADAAKATHSDEEAKAVIGEALAALRPMNQAGRAPREATGRALHSAVRQCEKHIESDAKLAELLRGLNVPLVEPAATEYRSVLSHLVLSTGELQAAVNDLLARLPSGAADVA